MLAGGVGGATGGMEAVRRGATLTAVNWIHLVMITAAIRGPLVPTTSHPIKPLAKAAIILRLIDIHHALVDESNASLLLESLTLAPRVWSHNSHKDPNILFCS